MTQQGEYKVDEPDSGEEECTYFYFNKIKIIESLTPDDPKTGQKLYETISIQEYKYGDLEVGIEKVDGKRGFKRALSNAHEEARRGKFPILHIDAHGDKSGVELASGERVEWDWLGGELKKINVATRLNLVVALAACRGGYLASKAHPPQRAPFFGLIAPLEKIYPDPLQESFYYLYEELFRSMNMTKAMKKMYDRSPDQPFNYGLCHARQIFRRGYEQYYKTGFQRSVFRYRENEFVRNVKERYGENVSISDDRLRNIYRTVSKDETLSRKRFEAFKNLFFMCDIYPDNRKRFNLDEIYGEV